VILADVVEEATRIADAARAANVPLRVLGGVAIALHAPDGLPEPLRRTYGDIDLVTRPKRGRDVIALLTSLGYEPNERFNSMNGHSRLVFYDTLHGRQIDVFVGEFRMCHGVPLVERLELDARTVPLAELLATKLQIVRMNAKDLGDVYAILVEHEVGEHDDETVNAAWLARLLAGDWGFWRTVRGSIELARERLGEVALTPEQRAVVDARLARLWERVEAEPKSLRWRSRARVGERVRWYDEPEEIAHAAAAGDVVADGS
jgi:hypothetical protein